MKGKIIKVLGGGTLSILICQGEEGLFEVALEWTLFDYLVQAVGNPIGLEIEYEEDVLRVIE